jgi:predicted permease
MASLLQDLKYGLRTQKKATGLTIIIVLTLGLSIGSSTTVFSVVSTILFKQLPYSHPEAIATLWRVAPAYLGDESIPWSPRDIRPLSQISQSFGQLSAFKKESFNLTGEGEPARVEGQRVSGDFFAVLGVAPAIGRAFSHDEDQPGREYVAVLSDQLWSDRFGRSSNIVGRNIELNGYPYTVVGVMPPGFAFPRAIDMPPLMSIPRETQIWVPMALPAAPRGPSELGVIARLKSNVTMAQAESEMAQVQAGLEAASPAEKGMLCRVISLENQTVGDRRRPLLLVLGAAGVVLLVACSNIAGLLLARSLERQREFTLRAALGASHSRLITQLLSESFLLAIWGGLLGIALAELSVSLVRRFGPANIPRLQEVTLDMRVLLFAAGITVLTGLLVGLTPAFSTVRKSLIDRQRVGSNSASSTLRNALLVIQISLALVLVTAAGLLVRTFDHLLKVDPGFNPSRVVTFELSLPLSKYKDVDTIARLYHKVVQDLQLVPGVQSVGLGSTVPLGGAPDGTAIRVPDHPTLNSQEKPFANYSFASPQYFVAIGAPLLRGRDFAETDTLDSIPVTIINSTMAKKFWPGEDPLGKQVGVSTERWPTRTIIGIVGDIRRMSLQEEPGPEMYVPYAQNEIKVWPSMETMQVAIRTQADPASVMTGVREAIHSADSGLPVSKVATLESLVSSSMKQTRFALSVLVVFGTVALLLASIGMFGVISYTVTKQTREIGVRMAIGAQKSDIFKMVLRQGARLTGLGVIIGLVVATSLTHVMASFLYGIKATDPLTFAAVSLLCAAVTFCACYLPAYRATRIDPMNALRQE